VVVPLDLPDTQPAIRKQLALGPPCRCFCIAVLAVWESLAIGEYRNDLKPEAGLCRSAVAAARPCPLDLPQILPAHGAPAPTGR